MAKVTKDASDTCRWRLTQEKPSANRRILLCGYYGFGNLGDEMILEAILQGLQEAGHTITVLAGDPKALIEKYGVQAQSYRDLAALVELVQSADLVVVGGGGLFQEHWPAQWSTLYRSEHGSLTYYPAVAILAASLGTPVALYGIGVGPVGSAAGKRLIRAAVASAQYVSVRDAESKRLLEEVGCNAKTVHLAADPVFSLSPPPISSESSPRKSLRVGVNLRPWSFSVAQESWEEEVVRGILQLARSTPIELLLLPFHHSPSPQEADEEVLKRLEHAAQREGVSVSWARPRNFAEGFQEIRGCNLVVAMRYHTVALAALAGVPFVALVYDPKVAHLTGQLRTRETSLPVQDITAPVLADLLVKVVEEPSLGLPEAGVLQELKQAAQADQRRLLALLGQRQSPETSPFADGLWVLGRALADAIQEREKREQEIVQARQEKATVEAEREALARKAARLFEENTSLAGQLAQTQKKVEKLGSVLNRITATKWYKLATFYWRLRERLRKYPSPPASSSPTGHPDREPRPTAGSGSNPGITENHALPEQRIQGPKHLPDGALAPEISAFDILVLPIIEWDFRFQRPQQLARHLAGKGHRVFYCAHRTSAKLEVKERETNVFEVFLGGPKKNIYQERLDEQTCFQYLTSIQELRQQWHIGAAVVVVQLPFWRPLAKALRSRFAWPVLYDCMDYHAGFSTNEADMLNEEHDLLRHADTVVVSSAALENYVKAFRSQACLIPNACDFPHFSQVPWRSPSDPPVVGYYGAIADWFDSDLVADLAEMRPHWQFLLVGSTYTADTRRLKCLPNVKLLGEKPYGEIPEWVAQMDVLIIPFKKTPLTDATNPVKFYEIMAAGKPLVSVPLPELQGYTNLVRFAESATDFAHAIASLLQSETFAKYQERQNFARAHTWEPRSEQFSAAAAAAFPLASIVVVTFNNLPCTKRCLASVLERTDWPNYELWVVDNGSTDGTPEFLQELAQKDPRVHLILNPDNLGFAAANNQALRQAKGEFLVLLNNDTVVPKTWLSRLIAHLVSHPNWGLVGPVTSWIGNEAQVSVTYKSLEEMHQWAASFMKKNEEKWFSIPVLAMFCVAMRREVFIKVGELDERFKVGMFEDDDYTLRVREAGYEVVCVEDVFVHHEGKAAFGQLDQATYNVIFETNRKKFEEKWQRPWIPHRYRQA